MLDRTLRFGLRLDKLNGDISVMYVHIMQVNIVQSDLLIFRHEAQIVISNTNYTDEMADPNSAEYRQLETDMCNPVSTSTREYVFEHLRVQTAGDCHE